MKDDNTGKIGGSPKNPVEIDEMYMQPSPRKMNQKQRSTATQSNRKAIVMGMKSRTTREVRAMVIPDAKRNTLQDKILDHVGWGAHIYTDQWVGYDKLSATNLFVHKTVNHMVEHVHGKVHINGIENFWSLLKRTLKGTYVAVEPFHLDAYVTEQVWRFNNSGKKMNDGARFKKAISQVVGKRLTLAEATGKTDERPF